MKWINKSGNISTESICPVDCPIHSPRGCGSDSRGGNLCPRNGIPCDHVPCTAGHWCGVYFYNEEKDL